MKSIVRSAFWCVSVLFAGYVVVGAAAAWAAPDENVLPGSGINYPGGYDPNTVGDVAGKAYGLSLPEKGPVRFRLETRNGGYTVLASASWYWKELGVDLRDGADVRVRGSITQGRDQNMYVVAQKISVVPSGRSYPVRDTRGTPLWGGGRGSGNGMGSSGAGGMMGGSGGMGMGGGMGGGMRR